MPRRIAQERVPTASNVGSRDVTWASQPTPLIPFRVFSRVSRAPFLRQSGVVTGTQFLIGLRVLCGLLCICSSSTAYRWATVFQKQSGTLRPHGLRGPCEHATPVFRPADTPTPRPLWLPCLRTTRGCYLFASYVEAAPAWVASFTSSSRPVLTL
jgi:hypothetical protein